MYYGRFADDLAEILTRKYGVASVVKRRKHSPGLGASDAIMKDIVDQCDVLFAVLDELPAGAMGGTGDVVEYARRSERRVVHLNPMERRVTAT